ncbi:MAG TPA: GNAT family N-acetyltransferase [Methylibium sp.]
MTAVIIRHLAKHQEVLPVLQAWFESEWPAHYGPGGRGDARQDLLAYSNAGSVPIGFVAFRGGVPCGFAALKREAFATHPQLSPWAGAAYVEPALRRQGIGRALVASLEAEARRLGYPRIYGATSTAGSLLERCRWSLLESVVHDGEQVAVYEKAL